MGDLDSNRNSTQYYGGGIHCSISSDEVRLTFCDSYEGYLVCTQSSRRHPNSVMQYFWKPVTAYKDNQGANL